MDTSNEAGEFAVRGAFDHPGLRRAEHVEVRPPGLVETNFTAVEEGPDAVLPPRSGRPAPATSVAARWIARLEAGD